MEVGAQVGQLCSPQAELPGDRPGSRLPSRTRRDGTAAQTASTRSIRLWPSFKSLPQLEISMPVRTISRYPSDPIRRASETACSRGRERTGPRA